MTVIRDANRRWLEFEYFAFAGICARDHEYEAASRLSSQPLDGAPKLLTPPLECR
jgi:hypothetical protein